MVITEENLTMQEKDKNLLKLPTKYVKLAFFYVKIPDTVNTHYSFLTWTAFRSLSFTSALPKSAELA